MLEELQDIFNLRKLLVSDLSSSLDLEENEIFYQMVITQQQKRVGHELTTAIRQLEGIKKIHYH